MEKMEVPSAQNVGREFVRQYYTMLNEAPHYLHRFYSHSSSFVHGGMERQGEESIPAIGQAEIHKKIASLNFKDCHAKICQVDSQASVEGAVVIQVVGELSNNAEPMRRFMQTFVLAPQSPKKYYVHNDIFRYQDEIFTDVNDENSSGLGTSADYEEEELQQQQQSHYQQHQKNNNMADTETKPYTDLSQPISNGEVYHHDEAAVDDSAAVAEQLESSSLVDKQAAAEPDSAAVTEAAVDHSAVEVTAERKSEPAVSSSEPAQPAAAAITEPAPAAVVEPAASPQKPTWAAMASRNTAASASGPPAMGGVTKPQATIRQELKTDPPRNINNVPNGALPQRPSRDQQPQQQQQRESGPAAAVVAESPAAAVTDESSAGRAENGVDDGESGGRGRVAAPVYPDSHQVFVGNVPHFISDEEIKEYFEQWGPVADIKINRKANTNVPNFGFASFHSADTVQKILNSLPLPKLHNKHRINVEEKKPRDELSRPRSGTRPVPQGKPFSRESYSPRGGGRGGFNNGRAGPPMHNGGYEGGRGNVRTSTSEDGRNGPPNPQR